MSGTLELLEVETAGAGVTAAGLFAASDVGAAGLVLVPMPRVRADSRVEASGYTTLATYMYVPERGGGKRLGGGRGGIISQVETAGEVEVVTALDDTGATDALALTAAVVAAAAWVVFVDASAGLLAQGIVTYTVWVTVSGRRLMVDVGAAPEAKTVLVRKEKGALGHMY